MSKIKKPILYSPHYRWIYNPSINDTHFEAAIKLKKEVNCCRPVAQRSDQA